VNTTKSIPSRAIRQDPFGTTQKEVWMNALSGIFSLGSDEVRKRAVWEKGHRVYGLVPLDPAVWRDDDHGNRIRYSDHGDRSSPFGWDIDHHPTASMFGGSDEISNLRPLHCTANARHGGLLGALSRTIAQGG
jgi:hypothetical protein